MRSNMNKFWASQWLADAFYTYTETQVLLEDSCVTFFAGSDSPLKTKDFTFLKIRSFV